MIRKQKKNTTAKKGRSTKAQTATTTKFRYAPNAGTYSVTSNEQENTVDTDVTTTAVNDSSAEEESEHDKGSMSTATKVCCAVGGVFAFAGVSFLSVAVFSKSKKGKI